MTNKDRLAEILRSAGLATPDTEAGTEDAVTRAGSRVLGIRITGDGAVDAWRRLLALRDGTGFHPVLSPLSPSAWLDRAPDEEEPFDDRAITAPRELVAEIRDAALADHLKGAGTSRRRTNGGTSSTRSAWLRPFRPSPRRPIRGATSDRPGCAWWRPPGAFTCRVCCPTVPGAGTGTTGRAAGRCSGRTTWRSCTPGTTASGRSCSTCPVPS